MKHRCLTALLVVAATFALTLPAAAEGPVLADLEGRYHIAGWDPGNEPTGVPDYEGSALLSRWGKTLRYHGVMDDMTYAGAAILNKECGTLSLSFVNGDGSERGVTMLRVVGENLEGIWAMDNGGEGLLGYEIWTRKK